ncbi:TPA: ABC transporter ATP-binding protein [Candidatus Poribacteria bacterium]|nr:ABC transporter ATP-binding protein [Candidatus Poribacteria bacterium]
MFEKLSVTDLTIQFDTRDGLIQPVDHVSFEIEQGQHVGLIGESGCGKTVTALSILGFERGVPGIVKGKIELNGQNILPDFSHFFDSKTEIAYEKKQNWRRWEKALSLSLSPFLGTVFSMIFQDGSKMLDPLFTIGKQLVEALKLSDEMKNKSKMDLKREACFWLNRLEMPEPEKTFSQYPHQLSGGMIQRVVIAMALASKPSLLIADEPTTALDVTVASKILRLLKALCTEEELTLLVISHNLAVIRELTQKVIVMYAGQIVEILPSHDLLPERIKHPYAKALLDAQISDLVIATNSLQAIPGEVPKPSEQIYGCRFHPRCFLVKEKQEQGMQDFADRCKTQPPSLSILEENQSVRCWAHTEVPVKETLQS